MKMYHEDFLKLLEENKELIEEKMKKDPNYLNSFMKSTIDDISDVLFKSLNKQKVILDNKKMENGFNKRLHKKWQKPLEDLEVLIEYSYEGAVMFTASFLEEAKKENNLVFYALRSIHARAILTAKECLALLKNGFADGAFGRWRTLYELAVIGVLLANNRDGELCERYLNFFFVQAYKEEKVRREKGYPSCTDELFEELKERYELMLKKYGKEYEKGDYGWANKLFNKRTNFSDIEIATSMDIYRGYYKSSSMFVHGNFKASQEPLGLMPNGEKMLLVGPSNYGLSIPMQNVAISLVSISNSFFSVYPTIDAVSIWLILKEFMDNILVSADEIQTKMENDDLIN